MSKDKLLTVLEMLKELEEDNCVPKNIKNRISLTIKDLETSKEELSIKVSRALQSLEDLTDDSNMQADTRTQLFNIVSALEIVGI